MDGHDGHPKSTFWRKILTPVPGRVWPSSGKEEIVINSSSAVSFKAFQDSISDAWAIDDFQNCHIQNSKIVQSSTLSVNDDHSKKSESQQMVENSKTDTTTIPGNGNGLVEYRPNKGNRPAQHDSHGGGDSDKLTRFRILLVAKLPSLDDLRDFSWSGIPIELRPRAWRLLAGYLPPREERREEVMRRKRLDYWNLVEQYFDKEKHQDIYRQIHVDIPRMSHSLFQQKTVQEMFERILFIWAIRHPASEYVQGMNDLVTPFFLVFIQELLPPDRDLETLEINSLSQDQKDAIEADCFWCFSKFIDGIQDNYIFAQIGIQLKVKQLKELIQRIDWALHDHLQTHEIDYLQFSFRWINNLLTREIPVRCSLRLWDTYLAEADRLASFQIYVCAAFLLHWRDKLLNEQDFLGLMMTLQHLPTQHWTDTDVGLLVAEAYRLKFSFANAPSHLKNGENQSVPKLV